MAAIPQKSPLTCSWPTWSEDKGDAYLTLVRTGAMPFCGEPVRMKRGADGGMVRCVYCAEHAQLAFTKVAPYGARDSDLARLAGHVPETGVSLLRERLGV